MSGRPGRFLLPIGILLITLLVSVEHVLAQEVFTATLSAPDINGFPNLTTYLDVHDPAGSFIHGLSPEDILLQENNLQVPVTELQELKPGVQFVIAITPGESFSIRDSLGVSRYEYLLQAILAGTWKDQPSGGDDFSLLTMGGPQLIHSSDPYALQSALEKYLPNDPNALPNLEVLASALQVAGDTAIRPGMERAILYITPPQGSEVSLGLQSIITSAIQQNIHIYVWLVAAPEVFDLPEIEQLRNLARETQAGYFAFSHDESVPDLENILEPLRYIYQLRYDSQIIAPGPQQLFAQVSVGSELVTSQPVSFEVNLQQPVVTLLTPSAEIVRNFSNQPTAGIGNGSNDLEPQEEILNIRITFPDGYERGLTRTSLFVDGVITAENTSPPFDQFVWDLRPYTQAGVHTLSVEVVDCLGLIGKSTDRVVKIVLPSTTQGMLITLSQNRSLLIGAAAITFVLILVLVLILVGRIRPKPYPGQVNISKRPGMQVHTTSYRENKQPGGNPLFVPAKHAPSPQTRSLPRKLLQRLPWFRAKEVSLPALAYIIPLAGPDEITLPSPKQIVSDDVSLGSDPHQSDLEIIDPSIEGLHARIHREGSSFRITDTGSVAGTWVNYELVPPEGFLLQHADIIHLGQVGFRFTLAEPSRLRKIVIAPLEPKR